MSKHNIRVLEKIYIAFVRVCAREVNAIFCIRSHPGLMILIKKHIHGGFHHAIVYSNASRKRQHNDKCSNWWMKLGIFSSLLCSSNLDNNFEMKWMTQCDPKSITRMRDCHMEMEQHNLFPWPVESQHTYFIFRIFYSFYECECVCAVGLSRYSNSNNKRAREKRRERETKSKNVFFNTW